MSDKAKVVAGLAVFLGLAGFPIWHALGASGDASRPDLALPKDATRCVEDKDYMTAYHMDLLNQWRDAVVRQGEKEYTSSSGEKHDMSLTRTCLECHSNTQEFCTRCHDYADVEPTCWACHIEPKGT